MSWINYYGLAVMIIIMAPNIIFAIKHKSEAGAYKNKAVEIIEQIGRYACMILMIFNIPYAYFGFWFKHALVVYLSVNGALCLLYAVFWIVCRNKDGRLKALSLSIIPTAIFLFSGIVLAYIPLIACAVVFGAAHIFISYKSFVCRENR